jgi:hypothetical protein
MSVEHRLLRNRLRARGRALGDKRDERSGIQSVYHLTELCAYEHWHRLLFTRFLTENHLLITDEANGSVPITLDECEEIAPEFGARDGFDLACRFASRTLPGVFRRDDPVLDLPIALNDQVELRKLLATLPAQCFRADDALGWTYQFWQAQRKKEVNDSGKKIGEDELAAVTQLFTEDYMVEFLLHNTLGAWWAGRLGPIRAASEEEARLRVALPTREGIPAISWAYLRFIQDETTETWLPAAGIFDGWPKSANRIRLLDPCMGSGHFLVFALPLLVRLRMEEEALNAGAAVVAVLKNNIYGLELDERCAQIAAFNVALTAWKLVGQKALPPLHLACSGLAPTSTEAEWMSLAGDNDKLRRGMMRLYGLFKDAPVLGSLINPRAQAGNLIEAEFDQLAPLLNVALATNNTQPANLGEDLAELSTVAQGLVKAAEILAGKFVLIVTNVPYLGAKKQDNKLKDYCRAKFQDAKADLATCFIERCIPVPLSNNPTQWIFNGHPNGSDQILHIAVARLLGYRWPRQTGSAFLDCPALNPDGLEAIDRPDGIVCLPPVNREQPAANRLRQLLTVALGVFDERSLITAAGLKGSRSKTLEDWLRDEFFEQHAKLFRDRPFIWHLWDGHAEGFHALVNYHKLDHATLQKLTYSYLGNWIQHQAEDVKADKPGAASRLGAAQALQKKLAAILEGEAPLDVFVRWKPIKGQALGWRPDLNDGVRQNIRPFLLAGDVGKRGAGLFRTVPLTLKDKDRGNEPQRSKDEYPWFWCKDEPGQDPIGSKDFVGTRWNNVHLTLEKKKKSRA